MQEDKMKIVLTIPKEKTKIFHRDWELLGKPLKKVCVINETEYEDNTHVEIEVKDDSAAPVFISGIFGKKGFLTKRGWKASAL